MSGHSQSISFPSEFTELRLVLAEVASFEFRDFVATFRFFDRAGNPLKEGDLDASYSKKLSAYFRYLLSSSVGVGNDIVKPIRLRKPAKSVHVEVQPWKRRDSSELEHVQNQLFAVAKSSDDKFIWTGRIGAK